MINFLENTIKSNIKFYVRSPGRFADRRLRELLYFCPVHFADVLYCWKNETLVPSASSIHPRYFL